MKANFRALPPNWLSFFRLALGFVIPILILHPACQEGPNKYLALWSALGLFLIGAATDYWDGWLARKHHLETPLGRILDPAADKVFILGAMTSFAIRGIYSYWYLVPIFIREIAVTFCRGVWMWHGQAIGAERAGKLKFGFQVGSVLCSFLFLLYPSPITQRLAQVFLIAALVMTLYSGFFFLKHNENLLKDIKLARAVATLGVGKLRPFPGTYGTLIGLAIVPAVSFDPLLHLAVSSILILLGFIAISRLGLAREEDPLEIVIDETCGILTAFFYVPVNWQTLLIGFIAFRFFDVTKVFPISWLEKRKGVSGIMLDDIGAGIYTWILLKLIFR